MKIRTAYLPSGFFLRGESCRETLSGLFWKGYPGVTANATGKFPGYPEFICFRDEASGFP
ncbi:MAG: hypothetical protein EGP73_00665 [Alistipes indistinctus]|nr:hypothetical protein [Alistipes indistinctus]